MSVPSHLIRLFARQYMPVYLGMGLSSRKIQADLRSRFGKAYRMQNIQADMRQVDLRGKKQAMLERLDDSQKVPRSALIEEKFAYDTNYKIHAKIELFNTDSQQVTAKRVSFFDDVNRGTAGWEDEFTSLFSSKYGEEDNTIQTITIVQVDHYPGRRY